MREDHTMFIPADQEVSWVATPGRPLPSDRPGVVALREAHPDRVELPAYGTLHVRHDYLRVERPASSAFHASPHVHGWSRRVTDARKTP